MLSEAAAVILVGIGQLKGVNVEAALRVARQPISQLLADVRAFVAGIVRSADVDVGEDPATGARLDQQHVAIADLEVGGFGGHEALRIW